MSPPSTLDDLLAAGREIWLADPPMALPGVATCVAVIAGDLAREARAVGEGISVDWQAVRRELGNLILSSVRWADDLGIDPRQCVADAVDAQRVYAQRKALRR